MERINISQVAYENNLENSEWFDEDCDCFGENFKGKFLLYVSDYSYNKGEFQYSLIIFDDTLENLLCDNEFVARLAKYELNINHANFCDFCTFISNCIDGNADMSKRPFEMRDLSYVAKDML